MEDSKGYRFFKVAPLGELAEAAQREVSLCGWNILVCRHEGKVYAVENRCSHQDKRLTGARMRAGQIICPVHGARFDLGSGAACSRPATRPLVTFAVRESEGSIEVGVPADSPCDPAPEES